MTTRKSSIGLFVVLGLVVALAFAFFVSPLASSAPDGLERVAIDQGFEGQASTHALAGGPLADYAVAGVDNSWLSTGLSGVVGVLLCFVIAGAFALVIRALRRRSTRAARTDSPAPGAG
jgi:hypothetical protein